MECGRFQNDSNDGGGSVGGLVGQHWVANLRLGFIFCRGTKRGRDFGGASVRGATISGGWFGIGLELRGAVM